MRIDTLQLNGLEENLFSSVVILNVNVFSIGMKLKIHGQTKSNLTIDVDDSRLLLSKPFVRQ